MSDARLRELEREFAETGAPGAETHLLRARLRSGGLTAQRLEVCAYLGHEPARAALSAELGQIEPVEDRLDEFRRAADLGHAGFFRLDELVISDGARELETLARWGREVGLRGLAAAVSAHDSPPLWIDALEEALAVPDRRQGLADRVPPALRRLLLCEEPGLGHLIVREVRGRRWDSDAIQAALRAELIPWALGYGDPLLDRVSKRQNGDL